MTRQLRFLSFVLVGLLVGAVWADEGTVVAEVDFDGKPPQHGFSYAFAGYGDGASGEDVQVKDKIAVTHDQSPTAGKDGAGGEAKLDATALAVPADSTYDYAGWAMGAQFDMTDKKLPSTELGGYQVSFDAKVAGTSPLSASKCVISFVVDDDKVGEADEDDFDDVVLQLGQGEDDGTGCFTLTSNYKSFTFDLEDMIVKAGAVENLKEHTLKGISFVVQAQGNASDIGADADNVLHVDNFKLIKKP